MHAGKRRSVHDDLVIELRRAGISDVDDSRLARSLYAADVLALNGSQPPSRNFANHPYAVDLRRPNVAAISSG
jgi:hypothetical protein